MFTKFHNAPLAFAGGLAFILLSSRLLPGQSISINRDARQEARQRLSELSVNAQALGATANAPNNLSSDLGVTLGSSPNGGLIVSGLLTQGAFTQAGFRTNDRIVSLNGQPVTSATQFLQTLTSPSLANQLARVAIDRGGQQLSIVLQPTLAARGAFAAGPLVQAGLTFDPQTVNQMVIASVTPQSPAFLAGLRAGDSIASVNGQVVTRDALGQALQNGLPLSLSITRGGQMQQLTLPGNALNPQSGPASSSNTAAAGVSATGGAATLPTALPGTNLTGPAAPAVASGSITPGGAAANIPFSPDTLNGASRFSPNVPRNPLIPGTAASGQVTPAVPFSPDALNGANRFSPLVPNPAMPATNSAISGSSAANAILQSQSITNPASPAATSTNSASGGSLFSNPANPASSAGSLNQSAGGFSAGGAAGGSINPVPGARTGTRGISPATSGSAPATSATGGTAPPPAGAAAPAAPGGT